MNEKQDDTGEQVQRSSAHPAPTRELDAAEEEAQTAQRESDDGGALSVGPRADREVFPIVGIGASAGGLEALQSIMRHLHAERIAFVVVQHLSPVHESLLTSLLSRSTSIAVTTVKDGEVVQPNHVYVIPANADLIIEQGVLRIRAPDRVVPRLPIDSFFRSLAADLKTSAIGVVLSGGGSDGTLGLKAIKAEGGITFVQDPGTATHPSMPQNALDSGSADFSLAPDEIAHELMRISSHPYIARPRPTRAFHREALFSIFAQLRAHFGVDFTLYKHSTLERRIERRMAVHKFEAVEPYVKFLQTNPGELETLYRDMLIGVTSFFRDREVFETLKNSVLPRILERRSPESPIRAWIAGCSSGEEAYSVAMCLLEQLGDKAQSTKIQIFATDLDEDAIRQARTGTYRSNIELDVSAERLRRFFVRKEEEYQVSRQIRDMVVFATQDLTKDPPFSRLDLVCCRNVLIYMQPALQKRVLRVFHYALNPDGFMLLGTSETVGEAAELFSVVDRKLKIYFKRNIPASATFDFGFEGQHLPVEEPARGQHEARPLLTLQQLADRKVIERFGPPGVVINDALEVLQFRGRTGPYLEPAPGAATLNVLKLARPELLVELRNTIHKALSENFQASSGPVQVKAEQGYREVAIEALPLQEAGVPPRCLLVLFREMTPPPAAKPASETNEPKDPRLIELERELSSTKNFLQTTIEELEAANEELKSANEELQSSNEELQSTNEELETSKEELQSTNEELATVNEELQNRMAELGQNNDDLQNVLSVSHNPLVIVGLDLRIRRFSQSAERLLNLIAGDIGRPIAHLTGTLNTPRLELLVADAVNNVVAQEVELSTADKHNYFLRILPYKTADHAIRGALLEFVRLGLTAPA